MPEHVCMDAATMCSFCESRAIDAYEHVNDSEPIGDEW